MDDLLHSGIKGQKWGLRRYQNDDGTLTEAGKARYDINGKLKNPTNMSSEDLKNSTNRLDLESRYAQLVGRSQPGKAMTRDNLIKVSAAFAASGAATLLFRKLKSGKWLEGSGRDPLKRRIGKTAITAMLAGGVGSLLAVSSSLGGNVFTSTPTKPAASTVKPTGE